MNDKRASERASGKINQIKSNQLNGLLVLNLSSLLFSPLLHRYHAQFIHQSFFFLRMSRIPVRTPSRRETASATLRQDSVQRPGPPIVTHKYQAAATQTSSRAGLKDEVETSTQTGTRNTTALSKTAIDPSQFNNNRTLKSSKLSGRAVSRTRSVKAPTQSHAAETPSLRKAKSSLALKDHIAKARAELQKSSNKPVNGSRTPSVFRQNDAPQDQASSVIDDLFSHIEDPFNQSKLMPKRDPPLDRAIQKAREAGQLNIATMQLGTIPDAVYSMYKPDPGHVIDFSMDSGAAWYEYADLTHFNAADNEIETIEETFLDVFGGVSAIDLHNNQLKSLPQSFLQLSQLTILNLAGNKLSNETLDLICQCENLVELNLARNALTGSLCSGISNLRRLNTLNLRENQLSTIGNCLESSMNLLTLNVSGNKISEFAMSQLANCQGLVDLDLSRNRVTNAIIDKSLTFPRLEALNLSHNRITALSTQAHTLNLPALSSLVVAQNQIQDWNGLHAPKLINLNIRGNEFTSLPDAIYMLSELRHLDISDNRLSQLPYQIGFMPLVQFAWQGNPVQTRGTYGMNTDQMLNHLRKFAPIQK